MGFPRPMQLQQRCEWGVGKLQLAVLNEPFAASSFSAGDGEAIIDIKAGSHHIACLSERHLYIWSSGPRR